HPLGEINARLTFGHLARAWLALLGAGDPSARGTLLLGAPPSTAELSDGGLQAPGLDGAERIVPLLHPSSPEHRDGAWMLVVRGTEG
ncbi:MAG: hypothetical protein MI919_25675, partial [Holophagales bacterium]|nr:hypothetical protein [Holophagales bacterium]